MAETTTKTDLTNEIAAVVSFWSGCLTRPVVHDNGDDMQSIMGTLLSANRSGVSEEQVAKFSEALTTSLQDESLSQHERSFIDVDYGPDRILCEACAKAGISAGDRFPWKTFTRMTPGRVTVSQGYRAPDRVLYEG